ncbi:MAG: 3-deoxy-7-phosphoheptulonate synthase class II [Oligoflexia bacterium]|nr:3-deoxy-7-phosphoheptulonate synthase class II [Oligoflexia bacterium]
MKSPHWSPRSWREKPAQQLPTYPDPEKLAAVERQLSAQPPLVAASETRRLKTRLTEVCQGNAFLLQGGDCAESFGESSRESIRDNFQILAEMAKIVSKHRDLPVVQVGRVAGQFAKPRSSQLETRNGMTLPAYRGDLINRFEFTREGRTPDPQRMETAYAFSAAKLEVLRTFSDEFYTSHEALLLPYEEALTRREEDNSWYDGSAHMLWVGERTRQLDGAHIEFARGIENPIGLKCGPDLAADELLQLIEFLNPANEPGRLTLITRMGYQKISSKLPPLIRAVQSAGHRVIWCCDPMHGNTTVTANGYKTRAFGHVLEEAKRFFEIHHAEGSHGGGLHFELTGKDVTECTGGSPEIREEHLAEGLYETLCDPRLNARQALELATQLHEKI